MKSIDSFKTRTTLKAGAASYTIHSLRALSRAGVGHVDKLPFTIRILLENVLRQEDGLNVTKEHIRALAGWEAARANDQEISFMPARVILQDFTGVPCVVDLASMRDAVAALGGNPAAINPLQAVDLVIDHSVQVDRFGGPSAFADNVALEYGRNRERYSFLKWGQASLRNFRVVPPGTGIVHQVNLEYLGQVVFTREEDGETSAFPDTLIGTDSHTTMINGLGIVGWGVGGIEAEAAMLGQPVSMLIPQVVGFKLKGRLPEGATATDLVLTVTQMLRKKGVVGKFVEFYGTGLSALSLPDRATIANMAPEYGATVGFFPVDEETLAYLRLSGRPDDVIERARAYCQEQGLFRTDATPDPVFSDTLELDLATVKASVAGPKRPQDRVNLGDTKSSFLAALPSLVKKTAAPVMAGVPKEPMSYPGKMQSEGPVGIAPKPVTDPGHHVDPGALSDGSVVIAAITSCTNTSNPGVLVQAGLLAKKAASLGLTSKPWVKTSLAPGSKVVIDYLKAAGVLESLEKLGFYLVGYGCTTCIGNSGPLPEDIEKGIKDKELVVASVLSGNRNFEGRIHPLVRANYLMSPPLVVAYALAGRIDVDLTTEPLGQGKDGKPVYLKDIWPANAEVQQATRESVKSEFFRKQYGRVFEGDAPWKEVPAPASDRFSWDANSTYIRRAQFLENVPRTPAAVTGIKGARVLALLGDSVTTDHISPAGSIAPDSPAGKYLVERGVKKADFNSYGARRGNHEVMVRGTFANVRLKNLLAPGTEGGVTRKLPEGQVVPIYDAAVAYEKEKVPLIVIAGKEYGSGSSRDWAAKGTRMLGIRAVLAESYERIHRSNLVMMGVLPLQFKDGQNAASLDITGEETFDIEGIAEGLSPLQDVTVRTRQNGQAREFKATLRIDTPKEIEYYRHGGIMPYVLRQILSRSS
jgi:aconitate hydratase